MTDTYGKVDTLFDRDENFRVITTQFRRPVFATIDRWLVTEKVDGTNMRILFETSSAHEYEPSIFVRGKTDNASIPPELLSHCMALGQRVAAQVTEIMQAHNLTTYTLFGEGYGPKIQGGGKYRPDQGFILFDIGVGGRRFLSDAVVTATATDLGIPRVPLLFGGVPTPIEDIVALVQGGFASDAAEVFDPGFAAEGVVARTVEPLYDNTGSRLIWKLKTRDFRAGKR